MVSGKTVRTLFYGTGWALAISMILPAIVIYMDFNGLLEGQTKTWILNVQTTPVPVRQSSNLEFEKAWPEGRGPAPKVSFTVLAQPERVQVSLFGIDMTGLVAYRLGAMGEDFILYRDPMCGNWSFASRGIR